MRRKVISCLMCALMIATVLVIEVPKNASAQVTEEWVARYDYSSSDSAHAIAIDESLGNIYVTGSTGTVAYDTYGNQLWTAKGNGWEIAVAPSSGNVYVTGNDGTRAFDKSGNLLWEDIGYEGRDLTIVQLSEKIFVTGNCDISGQEENFITIAYDSLGNRLWQAHYNGPVNGYDGGNAIAIDPFGKIIVAGTSSGPDTPSGNPQEDYTTIAYDSSGNRLWVSRYDGPGYMDDHLRALAIDSVGNIYVTGKSGISNYGDFTTISYNNSGNQRWIDRISGPRSDSSDTGQDIVIDSTGNIYITGQLENRKSDWDYATVKYNPSGTKFWTAFYDPASSVDQAKRIAIDSRGNIYVTGYSYGGGNGADYATLSYDPDGNQRWVSRYAGPGGGSDIAYGLEVDLSGHVYVTGRSYGTQDNDYATLKYSQVFPNQLPVADAGPDQTGYEGENIQFNGLASYDPDGSIVNYTWEMGDGTFEYGVLLSYIYHSPGIYIINLTVTDNNGASNTDTCNVTILSKVLSAIIDIDPDTLNLKSKGRWITCYIDLP
ncbi:MAG: SBBP repeat-containing protein, partial [Thermoplasmata archaeon]